MKKRQTFLPAFAALLAATVLTNSCTKTPSTADEAYKGDALWQFSFTRSGETTHTNTVATFRASLLHYGTGRLMSDGSYSGYYTDTAPDWPFPGLGWLYPCRTFDAPGDDPRDGMALDGAGNPILWDDPDWFENTDKDSRHGLRGPDIASQNINYSVVFTSPAVRMACYLPEGKTDIPDNYRWGFPIDRKTSTWAVSPAPVGMPLAATYLDNQYIYTVDPTLLEHRSKLTVKVACGSVSKADIRAVYFKNVISSAFYMPLAYNVPNMEPYENYQLDGNDGTDPAYDPLVSYYTANTYPSGTDTQAGAGDKLIVPDGEDDIRLIPRSGHTEDFIDNGEWADFTDADEWEKGATDKSLLTAVRDFPILPMDYSVVDGDVYKYEAIMPKLVVVTGINGNVQTTVRLAANFEPMKAYTVYIYVSSAYVQAFLTVSDWTIHRHWTEDSSEDTDKLDVSFGQYLEKPLGLLVSDWRPVRPDDEEGHITNNL